MREIIGNTTMTPVSQSDWNQTDEKKVDYIKNKPTLGALATKNVVEKNDLSQEVQDALSRVGDTTSSVSVNRGVLVIKSKSTTGPMTISGSTLIINA